MSSAQPARAGWAVSAIHVSVAAAAFGYFVDLYDIVIFGVVRVASLTDLGFTGAANTGWGIRLLNLQMLGLLIGGVAWGVIGDKFGRRFALMATITMYSLANIANAWVTTIEQYAWLRFIAGIGLAGELGAGVALVSELLPARFRGYGTAAIAFLGMLGALTASFIGGDFHWRTAYLAGGIMGLVVLVGRYFGLRESAIYQAGKAQDHAQGDLRLLVRDWPTALKFLAVIAVGMPIWYVSILFVTLAPEFSHVLGMTETLRVADATRWQSVGLALGSACSGVLSDRIGSRKKLIYACLLLLIGGEFLLLASDTATAYCRVLLLVGIVQGYWTVYLTMSAEQFGTNIRATVSTSVPNFVRATTVPVMLAASTLAGSLGWIPATLAVGAVVFALGFAGLWYLKETYGKDLDYQERRQ